MFEEHVCRKTYIKFGQLSFRGIVVEFQFRVSVVSYRRRGKLLRRLFARPRALLRRLGRALPPLALQVRLSARDADEAQVLGWSIR